MKNKEMLRKIYYENKAITHWQGDLHGIFPPAV